eukprot:scaffold38685_cov63-Phaeocystis_antarctica.AAC.1
MHTLGGGGLLAASSAGSLLASSAAARSAAWASRSYTSDPIRCWQTSGRPQSLPFAHSSARSSLGHGAFIILQDSHVSSVQTTGSVAQSSSPEHGPGRQNGLKRQPCSHCISFCPGASKLSESSPPRVKPIACTETARRHSAKNIAEALVGRTALGSYRRLVSTNTKHPDSLKPTKAHAPLASPE